MFCFLAIHYVGDYTVNGEYKYKVQYIKRNIYEEEFL